MSEVSFKYTELFITTAITIFSWNIIDNYSQVVKKGPHKQSLILKKYTLAERTHE